MHLLELDNFLASFPGPTQLSVACSMEKHFINAWGEFGNQANNFSCFLCRFEYVDAITHLLKERKIDPDCTSRDGHTPLSLTDSSNVIRELLRHGATADYELWKKHGPSNEQPAIKAFIVGDPGAGKSTLTKALETESKGLSFITNRVKKVSDVDQKTAGIVPHDIENKTFGRLTLYDFAGQKEFYAGHDAVLRSAVSGSSAAIFLIVADLCTSDPVAAPPTTWTLQPSAPFILWQSKRKWSCPLQTRTNIKISQTTKKNKICYEHSIKEITFANLEKIDF